MKKCLAILLSVLLVLATPVMSLGFGENAIAVLHYDKNAEDATGTIDDMVAPYGNELILSDGSGFTRDGCTLVGWNTESDGSGDSYELGQEGYVLPEGETTLYAQWSHKHKVCEGIDCSDPNHENHAEVEFQAWDPDTGIFSESGYYYVERDSTEQGSDYSQVAYGKTITITERQEITLCLNGKKLVGDKDGVATIIMEENSMLTICGCTGTGSITAYDTVGDCPGIKMAKGATLNLYSGDVAGGSDNEGLAAGVIIPDDAEGATFNMYGGSVGISDLILADEFTTVYIGNGAMNLYGGEISYLKYDSEVDGTGIKVTEKGKLSIGGNVKVGGTSGNEYLDEIEDAYVSLPFGKTITPLGKLTGHVDVTVEGTDPSAVPVPFITGVSSDADIEKYFWHADNSVGKFVPVGHNTGYFGKGDEITVKSSPEDGGTVTGGGTYLGGDSVTVEATPNDGYKFVEWTEDGNKVSADASYTFNVTGNRSLVAVFEKETGDNNNGNDTHTCQWGAWEKINEKQHQRTCKTDSSHTEVADHAGFEATCKDKAFCTECSNEYGEALGHDWPDEWTYDDNMWHVKKCKNDETHVQYEEHDATFICGENPVPCKCGAVAKKEHVYDRDHWVYNDTHHWHGCKNCKIKIDETEHDYPNKELAGKIPQICLDCGQGEHIVDTKHFALGDEHITGELREAGYTNVDAIKQKMNAVAESSGNWKVNLENTVLYEVQLIYSKDAGRNWYPASPEHFPKNADGTWGRLSVEIPVPEGDISTHDYTVFHMFARGDFGQPVGEVETIETEDIREFEANGKQYISFYVSSLSPFMVAWEEADTLSAYSEDGEDDENTDEDNKGKGDIPIDNDGDGDIDEYLSEDEFDEDKYAPIDKDDDGKADYYIPNGVLTDPDGDGIYTPDGKKGPKYKGVDLDGDGAIDIYVLLDDTGIGGVDSGDGSDILPWILVMMTALTAAAVTVMGSRYRRN